MPPAARLFAVAALAAFVLGPAAADPDGTARESGYIRMPDGVLLSYTAVYPDDGGRHPTLFEYSGYDPGITWDAARVSGHELTHTYGEGGHPAGCKSSSNCNLMTAAFSQSNTNTYWTDWSRCEVYRYFFHSGDTYSGPPEGCPNWYRP